MASGELWLLDTWCHSSAWPVSQLWQCNVCEMVLRKNQHNYVQYASCVSLHKDVLCTLCEPHIVNVFKVLNAYSLWQANLKRMIWFYPLRLSICLLVFSTDELCLRKSRLPLPLFSWASEAENSLFTEPSVADVSPMHNVVISHIFTSVNDSSLKKHSWGFTAYKADS